MAMQSTSDLSAQAHLAAGMRKLEALRKQFLEYLGCKDREVLTRMHAGQGDLMIGQANVDFSEWLS